MSDELISIETVSRRIIAAAEMGGYQLANVDVVKGMSEAGSAMLVDVRDLEEFERGHLPGAICFPMPMTWRARLQHRWKIRKLLCEVECKPVVFYSNSPSCRRSDVAARAAVITGFSSVYRFAGGVDAWRLAGLRLKIGPCDNMPLGMKNLIL